MSKLPHIYSLSHVCRQYDTGERPVLVSCSDGNEYVCKYSFSAGSANKLVCELIGVLLARAFGLNVPTPAFVFIPHEHLQGLNLRSSSDKVCIGSRFINNAVDITSISLFAIEHEPYLFEQLVQIALFDIWTANEDRNSQNYNLMFDIENTRFVPIDFGCIFNTSTFDYKLTSLTCTDSILHSELFEALFRHSSFIDVDSHMRFLKQKPMLADKRQKKSCRKSHVNGILP